MITMGFCRSSEVMARLAPLLLLCLTAAFAQVISSDPVGLPPPKIKLVSKSSTSMCDLDLLWDREDKTTLIFDVSGIQTDPKFLRTHAPVLYFSSVNGTESDPMPLIVANRPCNKTKTSLLEIECTEMKDKYRMTVVKTAAVNDSLGTAFFRWTSPFNTTSILDTYQLPKVEAGPVVKMVKANIRHSCRDSVAIDGKDKVEFAFTIQGTDTWYRFAPKRGPVVVFSTTDGVESAPLSPFGSDGNCTRFEILTVAIECVKLKQNRYLFKVVILAQMQYSMGLLFVRWKKYQDQNHPENTDVAAFSLPEVLGHIPGEPEPSTVVPPPPVKGRSSSVDKPRIDLGALAIALLVAGGSRL